ncbi:MAG: hypothetical protein GTN80_05515 [Nitrososphaeria archaeon]|nr:hypothetical protein [Nitrososphaeria archaeon]NIN52606.1 hypothetical protein [Nitrososphaeria archaeon]NIQ33081.1 hypothetical protein [Nitrososphaeria archaeon]
MSEKYRIRNLEITKDELLVLEPEILRSLIHERTHHTLEVFLHPILKGERKPPARFGDEVRILLKIWEKRNLSMDAPDIRWAQRYLVITDKIKSGEAPNLGTELPQSFTEEETQTVDKLIFRRRSIRRWKEKAIPEWMVKRVIEAGLAAPNACNMQCQRFLVINDKEAMSIIKTPEEKLFAKLPPVKIVVCQDMRIYEWMRFTKTAPQNIYFDAAAAADHMLLMAHALGLGGCWLTHTEKQAERLRKHYDLPKYFRMSTHIMIGWPDEAPVKSARIPVEDAIIKAKK